MPNLPSNNPVGIFEYLSVYLEPLAEHLANPDITDIYINRPQEIWLEASNGEITSLYVPALTEDLLWRMARQIASLNNQAISRAEPLLSASLPDGSRVQIIAPPATRNGVCMALRKHLSQDLSLEDYHADGAFENTSKHVVLASIQDRLTLTYREKDWKNFLKAAVRSRKTILISGGTSSGKTTFLNALLKEVPQNERILLIEDTAEIRINHKNAVGLIAVRGAQGEANVSSEDLLTASLRMRPDRILLGELRGGEAMTFLRAANTGHPGSVSTIHANSPEEAKKQLCLLARQSGISGNFDVEAHVNSAVDVVVQLERSQGRRRVAEVAWTARSSS